MQRKNSFKYANLEINDSYWPYYIALSLIRNCLHFLAVRCVAVILQSLARMSSYWCHWYSFSTNTVKSFSRNGLDIWKSMKCLVFLLGSPDRLWKCLKVKVQLLEPGELLERTSFSNELQFSWIEWNKNFLFFSLNYTMNGQL